METLQKQERIIKLFEIYQGLLTKKQIEIFKSTYYDNLSLSEIAENEGTSKQAIKNNLDGTIKKLEKFEKALNLIDLKR